MWRKLENEAQECNYNPQLLSFRFQRIENHVVTAIVLAIAGTNRVLDELAVRRGSTCSRPTFARACEYV